LAGRVEKFSEEYLIWAVRKTVQRTPVPGTAGGETAKEDADEGFAISEVVEALRAYGIPLQSTMPNTFGSKIGAIENPPPAVVEEARNHQRIFVHRLPGRDPATLINNLVQALNVGVPIPVGLSWPNYRSIRTGYLSAQKPVSGSGHAVTIVGYTCPTGRLEDTVFLFKNSWGPDWGQGGYGTVTYGYLSNYLNDAVVLEVQSG
ncbi:MAG: C1 family peptidase, partial [bacterium]|nr:C1 family peptidase [bacterium]